MNQLTKKSTIFFGVFSISLVVGISNIHPSTRMPSTFSEELQKAQIVFEGKVISIQPIQDSQVSWSVSKFNWALIKFRVLDNLKDTFQIASGGKNTIEILMQMGDSIEDAKPSNSPNVVIPGLPIYKKGEHVFMVLTVSFPDKGSRTTIKAGGEKYIFKKIAGSEDLKVFLNSDKDIETPVPSISSKEFIKQTRTLLNQK